ncbi:LPS assembly protein LptD [Sneathiella sp. P13V-1]|uniref:LPS-assembly protein LptD n=1 Tax=Sneathiella sp. P13V-1 TaxID=2697366 RepID=UPI00187B8107|nr:LPS assembly protein LptD [Sneathiella sp. P13V-1]MBE7637013.1 LPS assembly protein LptD [Sneathiella sp. P13V-1]
MRRFAHFLLTTTCLGFAGIASSSAMAQSYANSQDISFEKDSLFSADEIQYDQQSDIVTAKGNVEIVQGERVLKADQVVYNVRADRITASGNIVLVEPSGEVLFADQIELQNELKTGAVNGIRILFTDNSRLAAGSAQKLDENRTRLNQAVYTTCNLCKEDRNADPLWQLKSEKVEHDKAEKTITYRNAVLEFFGVPVLYTPYFSHPDPTVKRESGFLAPTAFDSSFLGYGVSLPYYYVIDEDKDLTFTPTITTKEGVQIATEYRQAFETGDMVLDASLTYVDERTSNNDKTGDQEFQGHIRGVGQFDLEKGWSWGYDFFATSNDTYLDKYDISSEDTLTSTAYLQAIRGRNFGKLSAYAFQGLEAEDDSGETPLVPAWLEYSYVSEPNKYGSRFNFDLDGLVLFRSEGQDTNRISASAGWHLPYTSPSGQLINLDAKLRGDLYYTRDQLADPFDPNSDTSDEFTGRVIPSLSLKWSYPFVRQAGKVRQTIEPIVEAVWSEAFGSDDTPNEDSLSFEFDDTNLFGTNRHVGLDEVEEGIRVNYGMNFGFYGENGGYTSLMIGQSVFESNNTGFSEGSGLEQQLSDYVTRLEIQPSEFFKLTHRTRIDQDDFSFSRNEVDLFLGTDENWLNVSYLNLADDQVLTGIQSQHQIDLKGRVKFAEYWSTYGGYIRDLEDDGGSIEARLGIEYLDECFGFALEAKKTFTRDRDVEPSTSIGFKIRLLPFN